MSGSGWDISSWEAFSKSHDDLKLFSKGQTTNSRTKIATWKEKMSAKTAALISPLTWEPLLHQTPKAMVLHRKTLFQSVNNHVQTAIIPAG